MTLLRLLILAVFLGAASTVLAQPEPPARADDTGSDMHVSRIVLLGTGGGPRLRTKRSQIATLLVVNDRPYLIDAGAGVVPRLTAAGWEARFIDRVFITHNHSDHSNGLAELYSFIWSDRGQNQYQPGPVQVIGPKGTGEVSDAAVAMFGPSTRIFGSLPAMKQSMPKMISVRELDEKKAVVYEDDLVQVTAVENTHYDQYPPGSDARTKDKSYSYRFDTPAGSIVFTGDTGTSDAVVELARNADVLVSEISIMGRGPAGARPDDRPAGHLAPEEVGDLASKAGVSTVLLTHLVPGLDDETDMSAYSTGVLRKFNGPVIVGQDLFEYNIAKPVD